MITFCILVNISKRYQVEPTHSILQPGQEITVKVVCGDDTFQIFVDNVMIATWSHIHNGEYGNTHPIYTTVEFLSYAASPSRIFSMATGVKWEYSKRI